jgi:TetR/AcrR family transcriptional regulator, transcriptional repressor for nem operon
MARPKTFDEEQALDAAVDAFREHGFEGTSAETLVQAMGIGRQSLYDTFGDKWQLYRSSLRRYVGAEALAHGAALRSQPRAIDGIQALLNRVIADAWEACLGISSICEFGRTQPELTEIHDAASRAIRAAILKRVREAQTAGDVSSDLDPEEVTGFLLAGIAGIRIAARGGADAKQLRALGELTMRALR